MIENSRLARGGFWHFPNTTPRVGPYSQMEGRRQLFDSSNRGNAIPIDGIKLKS
jgi:hypothetical protein